MQLRGRPPGAVNGIDAFLGFSPHENQVFAADAHLRHRERADIMRDDEEVAWFAIRGIETHGQLDTLALVPLKRIFDMAILGDQRLRPVIALREL